MEKVIVLIHVLDFLIKGKKMILFALNQIVCMFLQSTHVESSAVSVRSSNAAKHQFYLPNFYGSEIAQVYVGDGALLVPDNEGCTGSKELYKYAL